MSFFDRLRRRSDGLEEADRGEHVCECCGQRWLVSRGTYRLDGVDTRFVVMPTVHDGEGVCWMALEARGGWVGLRSVDQDDHTVAVVVEGTTPLHAVVDEPLLSRERVLGDTALKTRVFAVHDALRRDHDDVVRVFLRGHGLDYSFNLPDCVFALPAAERSARNQKNFAELGDRRFVRALLPLPVEGGQELRFGIWIEVVPADFQRLHAVFWDDEPAYLALRISGQVESSTTVLGNELRGAIVQLAARTADGCLFVVGADAAHLPILDRRVSTQELGAIARTMLRGRAN